MFSTEAERGQLKNSASVDSLLIRYVGPQGEYTSFVPVEIMTDVESKTINVDLQQNPYLFSTTLEAFLETGTTITEINPNFYITAYWNNGTTENIP